MIRCISALISITPSRRLYHHMRGKRLARRCQLNEWETSGTSVVLDC